MKPLYPSINTLIASIFAVGLLSGFGNITQDRKYGCAGKNDNGMVSFREFPMLHFSGRRLTIAGADVFSALNYEICDETDTRITFATHPELCRAGPADIKSLSASNGSLNIVSGQLELIGAQELHGQYQCKEILKN